jgi:hypothetical protein
MSAGAPPGTTVPTTPAGNPTDAQPHAVQPSQATRPTSAGSPEDTTVLTNAAALTGGRGVVGRGGWWLVGA